MNKRRVFLILIGLGFTIILGWLISDTLRRDYCSILPLIDCYYLWGLTILAIIGGATLSELIIAHRKNQGKWKIQEKISSQDNSSASSRQALLRSLIWISLASMLTGLPIMIKGAFGVTLFGSLMGLFIVCTVRGLTNQLPPVDNNYQK